MSRQSKAELDEQELAEAQADMEAQIDDELAMWDAGHIPGLSSFGFPEDDYAAYVGPSMLTPKNEQDISCLKEDWKEFLKKVEEDLK